MSLPTYRTVRARWLLADRVIDSKRALNDSLTELLTAERRMRALDRADLQAARAEMARQAQVIDDVNRACDRALVEARRRPPFCLSKPFWYGTAAGALAMLVGFGVGK